MSYVIRQGRRIEVVELDTGIVAKPKRTKATFVQVPTAWVSKLTAQQSRAAWLIATHLLHRAFQNHNQPVALGNVGLRQLGIGRTQKWRVLVLLERLGLISIERHRGRSPRITLHK